MGLRTARKTFVNNLGSAVSKITGFFSAIGRNIRQALKPYSKNSWFMILVVLMFAATQLALLWRPVVGIYFNAGMLSILVGLALWRKSLMRLSISVAILPVASLVTLCLPQTSNFAEITVYYSVILVLGLIYRLMFTLEYPLRETHLSLREYAFALPVMLVIGQAVGTIGYLMLRHHYPFNHTSLPLVAATVVVFAIAEVTLFQGLIQQSAGQIMHPLIAGILTSVLYVFASIDNSTILVTLFAAILGPVLAFIYYKKNNALLVIAVNAMAKLAYIALMASFVFR